MKNVTFIVSFIVDDRSTFDYGGWWENEEGKHREERHQQTRVEKRLSRAVMSHILSPMETADPVTIMGVSISSAAWSDWGESESDAEGVVEDRVREEGEIDVDRTG